jgi:cyclopropane fatty-acyl-phospholipid synthase-like methyltransferase
VNERVDAHARCAPILATFEAGALSAQIALMELLIATEDAVLVQAVLDRAGGERISELRQLFVDNRAGCERLAHILRNEQPQHAESASVQQGIDAARALFDGLVAQSEEASVALYSLGNPEILQAATREIVALLEGFQLLSPASRVLDLGCGIGRMEAALSSRVARVDGIDVSPEMIAVAQRRCRELPNVHLQTTSGRDLSAFADGSHELVLAVDSFPYVVQAGLGLAEQLFAEVARVLVPSGTFVILNFSYRGDLTRDGEDVARLSARHGFTLELCGAQPFSLWNGAAFRLRRAAIGSR